MKRRRMAAAGVLLAVLALMTSCEDAMVEPSE